MECMTKRRQSSKSAPAPGRTFIVDRFFSGARQMRKHFDQVFGNPRGADPRRFCWDAWNVPGQYRLLRTPAYHFFQKALYEKFHRELVLWGRRNLGCHDISPPWMSCYIDGCEQNFHGDLPHGPWSFVFSLTPWNERRFTGGETLLLRDEVLDFWRAADLSRGMEEQDVLESIEPEMNRLVVFDPRIPHGVRRVAGAQDVREGRLVIHGWFVNPRPFIEGPLGEAELSPRLPEVLSGVEELLSREGAALDGMASFRFSVDHDGRPGKIRLLVHSLRQGGSESQDLIAAILAAVEEGIRSCRFSRQRASSQVTLPLVFGQRS
jgi:hypothetical protein